MGQSTYPATVSKTMFRTTLTSGTSYTVPAGVTYLNVSLLGGGGGGGGGYTSNNISPATNGTSGAYIHSTLSTTPGATITYAIGAAGGGGSGNSQGGTGGTTTFTGATSAAGGGGGAGGGATTSAGSGATGAFGGNGGAGGTGGASVGGSGGSGKIDIEYWLQEIKMRTFAVIENNKVVNIIVGVEDEVVAANPDKYIDYTDGWDYNNGIDGGVFFPRLVPAPVIE